MPDADVRTRILQIATRLFGEQGYGDTSVRQLVEEAGVTKPTLYYHFGSKEGLFTAAVREQMRALGELVDAAEQVKGGFPQQVRRFAHSYVRSATEQPDAVRFLLTIKHRPSTGDHPEIDLLSMHLHHAQRLETLVREGQRSGEVNADIEPRVAVTALLGMVNLQIMAVFHDLPAPQSDIDAMIDIFLHGVTRR